MKRIAIAVGVCFGLLAPLASVQAAPCRDAKGKFIVCPPPAAAKKPCRDGRGKFIACSAVTAPR